jgi:hypothetical protein
MLCGLLPSDAVHRDRVLNEYLIRALDDGETKGKLLRAIASSGPNALTHLT